MATNDYVAKMKRPMLIKYIKKPKSNVLFFEAHARFDKLRMIGYRVIGLKTTKSPH
jgi:hypothetical protein